MHRAVNDLISLGSFVLALVAGALLLLVSGAFASCESPVFGLGGLQFCYNPIEVYSVMLNGAVGSPYSLGLTLRETTLLILAGVAVAVTFQAGIFNIGTQGQFIFGGLAGRRSYTTLLISSRQMSSAGLACLLLA